MTDTTKRPSTIVDRPTEGDLELSIHALHGIFRALNWIDSKDVHADDQDLKNTRHALVIAGEMITESLTSRF